MELEATVARVLAGDIDAYSEIVEKYHFAVSNFVAMTFPSSERVEDIAQEIFVRTFRLLPGYETDLPFWPWLRGIARNIVYEELRTEEKKARERRAFAEAVLIREAAQTAQETEEEQGLETLAALRECMQGVSERGRQILHWFYEEGLGSDQIASRMSCGGSAVRNSLMRVRRALRDCVKQKLEPHAAGDAG